MLRSVPLDPKDLAASGTAILAAWRDATVVRITSPVPAPAVRATYDALLPRIGTPRFLAEDVRLGDRDAQRSTELWFEVRYDPAFPNAYRHSPNAQPLHTDGSYIPYYPNATLMCCVASADGGGETIFISAEELVGVLREEQPELLELLETTPVPHARSGDCRVEPIIRRQRGELRLNWNYHCVAPDAGPEVMKLRERFHHFLCNSPGVRRALLPVKLHPGDAVVWKDEHALHGRNAFVAHARSERFLWKCAVDVGKFV
jgi:Taurine catabolism dioxygenase TauD, TfdA family